MTLRPALVLLLALAACDGAPVVEDTPKPVTPPAPVAAPTPPPAPKPARRFVEVSGTVTINGAAAAVDQEIGLTGNISTGPDSRAVITLGPGSLVEIRPNSKVELGKSARKESSLRLALGALWSFLPSGSSYEVETPHAVAGVRGTIFYVEAGPKNTYVCACDGAVDVGGPKQKKLQPVVSKFEHKGTILGAKARKKVPVQNHTKEQAEQLMAVLAKVDGASPGVEPPPAPAAPLPPPNGK